jgi:catechol 2,3-dioxygenase-like lactoylglutathione lyase family enzyme
MLSAVFGWSIFSSGIDSICGFISPFFSESEWKGKRMVRAIVVVGALVIATSAQAQEAKPAGPPPLNARFHHVHLNTTDPEAAIKFYTSKFKAERQKFAGVRDAVWTGDSWLLFNKVDTPPPSDTVSGIWHIGWGGEDMKAVYQKQVDSGTKFQTPLTDISGMTGAAENSGRFFYAYVDGPDHALIELNTANHHNFGHVHMFSVNPVAAGEWYTTHFGYKARLQKDPRSYHDTQIAPAAFVTANHVSMIIYPIEYLKTSGMPAFKDRTELAPTRGRVIDHLGFAVDNVDEAVAHMKAAGVKVTAEPVTRGQIKFAFVEGPDQVGIELIEDHSPQPPKLPN